jgi:anaerobic nitric oxide reductase flavorubredoxin
MPVVEIKPDIYWIGVNDRTTDLFEGLWPITREGVSYNSYLINDEKKVIIDLAKSIKTDVFFENISEVISIEQIDYLVVNHMEPDHTGILSILKRLAPKLTILTTPKAEQMLQDFYGIKDRVKTVEDTESVELGKRTLQFFHAPFVHWPETMVTYETSDKILFSCDAFGGYGALRGAIFDDQCTDPNFYEKESLRYFSNIVAKFSRPVVNAIEKLAGLRIDVIAPSHGLIWRKQPSRIIELYKQWSDYATGPTEPAITLIYGSMYGNTETMMNAVVQGISTAGTEIEIFDAGRTHPSYILPSIWTKSGVVIGAPTYEASLFPPVARVLELAALKRMMNKKALFFGSYGWSGGALKEFKRIVEPLKWEIVDAFEFPGGPSEEKLKKGEEIGRNFAKLFAKE